MNIITSRALCAGVALALTGGAAMAQPVTLPASGPPDWSASTAQTFTADPRPDIRDRYAELRDDTAAWHERKRNRP